MSYGSVSGHDEEVAQLLPKLEGVEDLNVNNINNNNNNNSSFSRVAVRNILTIAAVVVLSFIGVSSTMNSKSSLSQTMNFLDENLNAAQTTNCSAYSHFALVALLSNGFDQGYDPSPNGYALLADRGQFAKCDIKFKAEGYNFTEDYATLIAGWEGMTTACLDDPTLPSDFCWADLGNSTSLKDIYDNWEAVPCVESCLEDRVKSYQPLLYPDGTAINASVCNDPVNVAYVYAPTLMKSCFSPDEKCIQGETTACEEGCYDCVTECLVANDALDPVCVDTNSTNVVDTASNSTNVVDIASNSTDVSVVSSEASFSSYQTLEAGQTETCSNSKFVDFPAVILDAGGWNQGISPLPSGFAVLSDRGQYANCLGKTPGYDYKADYQNIINNYDSLLSNCINNYDCLVDLGVRIGLPLLGYDVASSVSCLESCVFDRVTTMQPLNDEFGTPINASVCTDAVNVAFMYAPTLLKSCMSPDEKCQTGDVTSCTEGCYDCIDQCLLLAPTVLDPVCIDTNSTDLVDTASNSTDVSVIPTTVIPTELASKSTIEEVALNSDLGSK
jgi:hypothetical protein